MRIASVPFNEELRLQDLYSYDIIDTEREKEFDDLLEVAAQIYGCPIAAISFVDKERQWFKSSAGLPEEVTETPRDLSFCTHTILKNDVLIVEDATKDERFCNNPLVTDGLRIRFYAGAPIISTGGYRLGSICIVDSQPRELTKEQAKSLSILSQQISKLLELRLKNKLLRKRAEEQLQLEKMLLQKTLQEQETQMISISTELHENIAQILAATRFYLEMAEGAGVGKEDLIRKSKENIASLVGQVRELSQSIAPTLLKEVELKELLTGMLGQFHNQTGLAVKLVYEGNRAVTSSIALTVYRIVEEQLANIRRHAKATEVTIAVNVCQSIFLSIKDNGVGVDVTRLQKGVGLNKIVSKAESYQGRVEITSGVKGGCELTVVIPK